tara:strand:- start:225 stop:839 length:615 start_codon:yes stop_codon:yes gene_type:complete
MSISDKVPTADDFISAINELGTFIDISPDALVEITRKAMKFAYYRQLKDIPIEMVMSTSIVSVTPETGVQEAISHMIKNSVSGLPVLGKNKSLVGLITEADVLRAMGLPHDKPPHDVWDTMSNIFHHFSNQESIPNLQDENVTVSDLMTKKVITTSPVSTVQNVLDLMRQNKVKRVLVTDLDNRLVGIVSRSDLMKVILGVHLK